MKSEILYKANLYWLENLLGKKKISLHSNPDAKYSPEYLFLISYRY